jgi:pyruvate,water dikinase
MTGNRYIALLEDVSRGDVAIVGGKNASLGEMIRALSPSGIAVPDGFATTAAAYWQFVAHNGLAEVISRALAQAADSAAFAEAGKTIRAAFLNAKWPEELAAEIREGYRHLAHRSGVGDPDVAVRSSATAEDLPEASFAGQQESFLNIRGKTALLDACRRCYASLFTDRAISYREAKGFDHMKIALSIGIQRMVRSDLGSAGVMFTIDTETGFDRVVLINAAWGLGENVVQGAVDPDEYAVFKPFLESHDLVPIIEKKKGLKAQKMVYGGADEAPTHNIETSAAERDAWALSDDEILQLSRWAVIIESHYGMPMDIEWAKDGRDGRLYIVQARPETAHAGRKAGVIRSYRLKSKGRKLAAGLAIGDSIVAGKACIVRSPDDITGFPEGAVLVATTTDPDWVPLMKRAAAIVTDRGGRTSHAAIVSRELGLPAVIGTGTATQVLNDGQPITVSCAEGDEGAVYEGIADFVAENVDVSDIPATRTQIMLNLADPGTAFQWWRLPSDGVGLVRMEFVVSNHIKVHPMALVQYESLKDETARRTIAELTKSYPDKREYFVDRLALGLGRIAAAHYPHPVIVRMSDFKTNEYASLIGGEFEPIEENPMIGFRGASRYYSPRYRDGFALECQALKRLRDGMGFKNVIVMIPFCRTTGEADKVLEVMAENGLERGKDGLKVYVMCEIPSNVILARDFARRFDGFSIGSNDLTQLTLGVDRDSEELAPLFNEQDPAVTWMIEHVISEAHKVGAKIGLCGQAPSDHPAFAEFLVHCGIDSISVTPDSFLAVKQHVAQAEKGDESASPGMKARDGRL